MKHIPNVDSLVLGFPIHRPFQISFCLNVLLGLTSEIFTVHPADLKFSILSI